jgi:hypothetical protein
MRTSCSTTAWVILCAACGSAADQSSIVEEDGSAIVASLSPGDHARTTGNLNLRAGPSRQSRALTVMPTGAEVEVRDRNGVWYAVLYGSTAGWAHGRYLERIMTTTDPTTPATPAAPGERWRPAPGTSWQWQLTGTLDDAIDVKMYDIDLFNTEQPQIDRLHAAGRIVICYFSAGSYEPGRPDSGDLPAIEIGRVMEGWPDERWLDIRSSSVRSVMSRRLDVAVSKRCDGVEPDNVDGFTNGTGFSLTASDQLDFNRFIAAEAHARGLSVGLKNDGDQIDALVDAFDWALNEECFEWAGDCDQLAPFIAAGKAVFQTEYGGASTARRVCSNANARGFDTLIKDHDVSAFRIACR